MTLSRHYKVYAVIVIYNGAQWIDKCLGSLRNSSYPVKCIVIDNNSSDNSPALVKQNFSDCHLIENKSNLGFGMANNIGISEALEQDGDFIFLLNQDAWVQEDTIEKLLIAIIDQPKFGIVSPLHYTGKGDTLDFGFRQYLLRQNAPYYIDQLLNDKDDTVYQCNFVNAAAWMVSKECLRIVGGFSYIFYHYGEDRDYVQRMKWLGLKLGFVNNTRIFHDRESRFLNDSFSYPKKLKYYVVGCMARCCDINYSLLKAFLSSCIWALKELVICFFKGNFVAPFLFFNVITDVTKKLSALRKYRRVLRTKEDFLFLDFDRQASSQI
jgi:GT2 family glycosyltransferase